ncbi:MAG: hypothetical protein CM15mP18_3070 [Methanobacteriota archaeon]|nr:MAG: hypothetical protein CM15mP18_3070 [Euryarchaeota archaeon]
MYTPWSAPSNVETVAFGVAAISEFLRGFRRSDVLTHGLLFQLRPLSFETTRVGGAHTWRRRPSRGGRGNGAVQAAVGGDQSEGLPANGKVAPPSRARVAEDAGQLVVTEGAPVSYTGLPMARSRSPSTGPWPTDVVVQGEQGRNREGCPATFHLVSDQPIPVVAKPTIWTLKIRSGERIDPAHGSLGEGLCDVAFDGVHPVSRGRGRMTFSGR